MNGYNQAKEFSLSLLKYILPEGQYIFSHFNVPHVIISLVLRWCILRISLQG